MYQENTITESERNIPVVQQTDVIVCGAGPAGIGAALAAARSGARVQLIEVHGCLGGVWTAGLLTWIIDTRDKPGILVDLMRRLEERGAAIASNNSRQILTPRQENSFGYNVEEMKVLLEEMCVEAGIAVRYHTRVAAATVDENNNLTTVITESKSGREAWQAKAFVDCSGDGDLAALAGCGYDYGDPETGLAQPMSLLAIIGGVRADEIRPFHRYHCDETGRQYTSKEAKAAFLEEMKRVGITPSYEAPTLFKITDNLFTLMTHHAYSADGINANDVTAATLAGRRELHKIIRALKRSGPPWENLQLIQTAEHIGVREGRRIHGLYTVSIEDVLNGARHSDAVCRSHFSVDIHSTDPSKTKAIAKHHYKAQPFDIPLRALIAKDVNRLLIAGRCISGSFQAHASYRVTGNAVALGQGAGVAAALSAKHQMLPQKLPWKLIEEAQQQLNTTGI